MDLDEAQRKKIAQWIADGLKLSEIQNRIASELGLRMTYMDVRFLVDDLKLTPKDVERPKAPAASSTLAAPAPAAGQSAAGQSLPAAGGEPSNGRVSLSVDQLARPGALASGKVSFRDGNQAEWYLDQTGRLGLVPQQPGYKPSPADVQQFQVALESELSKLGF
jgi:hypothetical protein